MDYQFICEKITKSTGCIARFYHDGAVIAEHSPKQLSIDPITPYLRNINYLDKPLGIITTPLFQNIAYITIDKSTFFTIGPTMPIFCDPQKIEDELNRIGIEKSQHNNYKALLSTLPCPTITELANKLAFFYHLLSGEKVSVEYILGETNSLNIDTISQEYRSKTVISYDLTKDAITSASYDFEVKMMSMIRFGQLDKLKELLHNSFNITTGELSKNSLRQQKNLFICTVTMAARTAIEGGLDCIAALQASDNFIQRMEELSSELAIISLLTEMLFFYTEKINQMTVGNVEYPPLITRVFNHVSKRLSQQLKVYDIAKELNIDRAYLSTFFKKNCQISLSDYIIKQKIQESKRMLSYSDIAIAEIAYHFCFSSQSHYQNIFKRLEGITPGQFRQKYSVANQNSFT